MKHHKLLLALIALVVVASPMLVLGAERTFSHPTSLPKTASDKARDAHDDRGTHGHEGTGEREDDNETAAVEAQEHDDNESATGALHEHQDNDTATDHDVDSQGHDVDANETCVQNGSVLAQISLKMMPVVGASLTHSVLPLSEVMAIEEGC